MGGLLVVWAAFAMTTWWLTSFEVNQLFDSHLFQTARLLAVTTLHESEEHDLDGFELDLHTHGYEYPVIFQVWTEDGRLLMRGPKAPREPISRSETDGFTDSEFGGETWRVFTLILQEPSHRIQIADAISVRHALIKDFMLNTLKPFLIVFPLLGLLWFAIDRGLAPLRWVAREISERESAHLTPVPEMLVPEEIAPLVTAINALFVRLQNSLDSYSRFTADAAHELRTPLAGTIAQMHAALSARDEKDRQHGLEQALKGLKRLNHLIDQLLAMARADSEPDADSFVAVDISALATDVVSEYTPRALEKGVDIELQAQQPVHMRASAELIQVLLGNLISNAIRATPQGGLISVGLKQAADGTCLIVEDNGPGIPDGEKAAVFRRFHRLHATAGPGSGLGLSIVQAVATAHGAAVALEDRVPGPGLRVVVLFPASETCISNDVSRAGVSGIKAPLPLPSKRRSASAMTRRGAET
jgi:two-component system sensor histidine kinase QseC